MEIERGYLVALVISGTYALGMVSAMYGARYTLAGLAGAAIGGAAMAISSQAAKKRKA